MFHELTDERLKIKNLLVLFSSYFVTKMLCEIAAYQAFVSL